jgi:phage shock protein PspC (stress-responsive transcriptional regulator)
VNPTAPLRRDVSRRWVAGVCAGIARRHGWNVGPVRACAAAATLLTGVLPGVATYLLAWLFVPAADDVPARHGLSRSASDRKIAGVCGGLAAAFGLDATLLRLLAVFATLATAVVWGVLAYLVAWWVLPVADRAPRESGPRPVLGA